MAEHGPVPPQETGLRQISDNDKKLLSDHYEKTREALENLYIPRNIGGRIKFMKSFPLLAPLVLGEALMKCDTEGTSDLKGRAALEREAVERLEEFLDTIIHLEKRSIKEKMLDSEYITPLIERWGRDVALLFYDARIVDKFAPAPRPPQAEVKPEHQPAAPVSNAAPDQKPAPEETPAPVEMPAPQQAAQPSAPLPSIVAPAPPPAEKKENAPASPAIVSPVIVPPKPAVTNAPDEAASDKPQTDKSE